MNTASLITMTLVSIPYDYIPNVNSMKTFTGIKTQPNETWSSTLMVLFKQQDTATNLVCFIRTQRNRKWKATCWKFKDSKQHFLEILPNRRMSNVQLGKRLAESASFAELH